MITQQAPSVQTDRYIAFTGLSRSLLNELLLLAQSAGVTPRLTYDVEDFESANPSAQVIEVEVGIVRSFSSRKESSLVGN